MRQKDSESMHKIPSFVLNKGGCGNAEKAKEMMKADVLALIDATSYRNLVITVVGLADNSSIFALKNNVKPGMVGPQYDDFGKKIGTGVFLKRELKGYIKKIKRQSKNE